MNKWRTAFWGRATSPLKPMQLFPSHTLPSVEEYNALRRAAEWPTLADSLVETALSNSLFGVVVREENGHLIGMGRIVGDGAVYFHLQDIIVKPAYQRKGVGKLIMGELLSYLDKVGGRNTNIGLMCSKGREAFYKRFGFIERPNHKFGAGMIKIKD